MTALTQCLLASEGAVPPQSLVTQASWRLTLTLWHSTWLLQPLASQATFASKGRLTAPPPSWHSGVQPSSLFPLLLWQAPATRQQASKQVSQRVGGGVQCSAFLGHSSAELAQATGKQGGKPLPGNVHQARCHHGWPCTVPRNGPRGTEMPALLTFA